MRITLIIAKKFILYGLFLLFIIPYIITLFSFALFARATNKSRKNARIVFGPTPILNSKYWSQALKSAGYNSCTVVIEYFGTINKADDWDYVLKERYPWIPIHILRYLAFLIGITRYDVFVFYNTGFFLGATPIWWIEKYFFKLAGKKTILFSHGGDSYVYGWIRSPLVLHGLLMSYPEFAKSQTSIAKRVSYWTKNADIYISMVMLADGIGRSDVIIPSYLFLDDTAIRPTARYNNSNGKDEPLVIVHCPNHTGFKGTEFIEKAIEELKSEGYKIDYRRLERLKNDEIIRILTDEADILIDQILFTGYALNATEGLAAGLVVVGNLEDENYVRPMRLWSFLEECPIVSSSPEEIKHTLQALIINPELRLRLAKTSRLYFEKYHTLESSLYLFEKCLDYLYGLKGALKNIYHPITGEYPNRMQKIKVPLINNRISA